MKEYEKLAEEFSEAVIKTPSVQLTTRINDLYKRGYMVGFLKCRDSLLQELLENYAVDGFIQKRIREFGEKEV